MPATLRLTAERDKLLAISDELDRLGFRASATLAHATQEQQSANLASYELAIASSTSTAQQAKDAFVYLRENWSDFHAVLFDLPERNLTLDVSWDINNEQPSTESTTFHDELLKILADFEISLSVTARCAAGGTQNGG